MCFAENAARDPWEPLHVELGFAPEVSIVVVAARGLIVESSQEDGAGEPGDPGQRAAWRRHLRLLLPGPWRIARRGVGTGARHRGCRRWHGVHAVKEYIFQHARTPVGQLRDRGHWGATPGRRRGSTSRMTSQCPFPCRWSPCSPPWVAWSSGAAFSHRQSLAPALTAPDRWSAPVASPVDPGPTPLLRDDRKDVVLIEQGEGLASCPA